MVRHSLPFTSIPIKMLTHMTFFVVKMLNHFPVKGGISSQYSPKTIMSGQTLNYKQCSLPFGSYCQVHEEDGPRNSLAARTQGAISLGPSSNRQGGQLFLSLTTRRILSRRSYTVLPMPSTMIGRINDMAKDQPRLLMFADRDGNKILSGNDPDKHPAPPHKIPGVIGDIAVIPGADTEIGIKPEEIEPNKNDLGNMPTTTKPIVEDDINTDKPEFEPTADDVPMAEHVEPVAIASPTKTKTVNI